MLNHIAASHDRRATLDQLEQFTSELFDPRDLIEIRAIVSRGDRGGVVWRRWLRTATLLAHHARLTELNRDGANIYFGVNPRSKKKGTKSAVRLVRSLWADIDEVTVPEAFSRTEKASLPAPSICVSSGHGVHLYWLLERPAAVAQQDDRYLVENILRRLAGAIQSDATHDVSRLLRLPGFHNVKSKPVECELVSCNPERKYPLRRFDEMLPLLEKADPPVTALESPHSKYDSNISEISMFDLRTESVVNDSIYREQVRGLLQRLEQPATDRSRRDFAVVCELLKLGIPAERIANQVAGKSKFTSAAYTVATIKNAQRAVGRRA